MPLRKLHCTGHSNSTRVGLNLVGGGGGCSCMLLLHPAPTWCCPDLCTLHWWGSPSINRCRYSTGTCGGQHLLQLALVVFSIHQLTQILRLYTRRSSPVTLQLALVVFFLPATGANNTLLALCVGGCMWWCQLYNVVVVVVVVI